MSKVSQTINIKIPDEILKGIEQKLDGVKKPEAAVKTVANNTAKQVQKLLIKKASKEYVGKAAEKSNILAASTIQKSTINSQTAIIRFKSPIHEIKEFHVSSLEIARTQYENGKRVNKNIKGNVLKGEPKILENAFVVQFKNGHISVVHRIPGTHMKSNPKKEKLEKLLSPSYKAMIGSKQVYGASSDAIGVIMYNEAEKVLKKILGGK